MGELIDSYLNQNITHHERIKMAITAYFFLHLWKYHIETLSNFYPSYISISRNFLAMQTFNIMISLVESLVLLIKIHQDYYKDIPLLPWKYGTESCEHIFNISCQFCSDFNYLEIIQIVTKINQYLRSVKSDDLIFRKEKKMREGYDFNEYEEINLIGDNLECLHYWPSDTEIDNAIKVGYEKAVHLAKYLEMIAIPNNAHYFAIYKRFSTLQLEDFWDDNPKFKYTDDEVVNNNSINIFQSINCAISKLSNQESQEEPDPSDSDIASSLKKNYGTCQVIVKHIKKLPNVLWYPNHHKDFDYLLDDGLLNIEYFLNSRQYHDAYSNRKLECKNILLKNHNSKIDGEFDINKASGLVSYLTKNDSIFNKSRENQ
ncbi:hypothetical protein RclHR1_17280005 [Rhizophagus clarus]|uniref:Uncharacterized protein n=1 Tax=Rhizophagus clarus TaxID=94130 RepID=A0A2Z6QJR3_9GLOM|nr:hypothetical protein RclHR1_17280005 [Rhizophagus clarus]GES89738.1 hypothetical protein GLOIN_2v1804444 [Rhizophagus clarus]